MKRTALKTIPLALVPSRAKSVKRSKEKASSAPDYFDGWLQSITPAPITNNTGTSNQEGGRYKNQPLTQHELNRVSLSTIRESSDHRHWPPGVFEKFLVADVIRRSEQH